MRKCLSLIFANRQRCNKTKPVQHDENKNCNVCSKPRISSKISLFYLESTDFEHSSVFLASCLKKTILMNILWENPLKFCV